MLIDTTFDVRTDAGGRDPDTYSHTLRAYHRTLWSKPLPSGQLLHLDDDRPGAYLYHQSDAGEFVLASDSVIPTFTRWRSMRHIVEQLSEEENESFRRISYTIGGMMLFPANRVNGKQTINGARGFTRAIADRFDLTLECIRRHYASEKSPLDAVLERYANFFALFESFGGYVNFFMLQDLVGFDGASVQFFMPFDGFSTSSIPGSCDAYRSYRQRTLEFVEARNCRIDRNIHII